MNYEIFRNECGLYLYRGSERSVDQRFIFNTNKETRDRCETLNKAVRSGLVLKDKQEFCDFVMGRICSCRMKDGTPLLMTWCEEHCPLYYRCNSIAMANDLGREYENLIK